MIEKIKTFAIITLLSSLILVIYILTAQRGYVNDIESNLQKRDSIILQKTKRDAELQRELQEYAVTIEQYTSKGVLTIDGRELSNQEIIKIINDCRAEKISILENYNKTYDDYLEAVKHHDEVMIGYRAMAGKQDSLAIYRYIANKVKKDYGIEFRVTKKGKALIFEKDVLPVDTAMAIYPYLSQEIKNSVKITVKN